MEQAKGQESKASKQGRKSVGQATPEPEQSPPQDIKYVQYANEDQLHLVVDLIKKDLSEPYSVFTYRYFINNWPDLCILVSVGALLNLYLLCSLAFFTSSGHAWELVCWVYRVQARI